MYFLMSCNMRTLWQRFGRGARNFALNATAILLAESKWFDDERAKRAAASVLRNEKASKRAADSGLAGPPAKRPRKSAALPAHPTLGGDLPIRVARQVQFDGDDNGQSSGFVGGHGANGEDGVGAAGGTGEDGLDNVYDTTGLREVEIVRSISDTIDVGGMEQDMGGVMVVGDVANIGRRVHSEGRVGDVEMGEVDDELDGFLELDEGHDVSRADSSEGLLGVRGDRAADERADAGVGEVQGRCRMGDVRETHGAESSTIGDSREQDRVRAAHHARLSSTYDEARRAATIASRTRSKKRGSDGEEVEELSLELDNLVNARTRPHNCHRAPILAWFKAHLTGKSRCSSRSFNFN